MADLAPELLRRNARLRAWCAYGVPLEGRFFVDPLRNEFQLCLDLDCRECGAEERRAARRDESGTLDDLLRQAVRSLSRRGCPHLAPLLGEDPPEIIELTALELLAGG